MPPRPTTVALPSRRVVSERAVHPMEVVATAMTRSVVTVRPDGSLANAGRMLRSLHISGMPVVDDEGHLVGMISETDVFGALQRVAGIGRPRGLLDLGLGSRPPRGKSLLDQCRAFLEHGKVREVMTKNLVIVRPSDSLTTAADRMVRASVNRLPVLDHQERLVGLVARSDVLGGLGGRPRTQQGRLQPSGLRSRQGRPTAPFADI